MTMHAIPDYSGPSAAIIPGSLYIAACPGGAGRSQRVSRRAKDLTAAAAAGVRIIVSGMRSRHALTEYARYGFGVRWHPIRDMIAARTVAPALADEVTLALMREPGAVLVHVDAWNEFTTAVAVALILRLGIADTTADALEVAGSYGLPVGDMARAMVPAA